MSCLAFQPPVSVRITRYSQVQSCCNSFAKSSPRASASDPPSYSPAKIIAVVGAASLLSLSSFAPSLAETISKEACISGEGPGCAAAAEESPYIKGLLEKSKANKAKRDKDLLEKYWAEGYGTYFSYGFNKELIKDDDGKWKLQQPNDMRSQIERRIAEAIVGKKAPAESP